MNTFARPIDRLTRMRQLATPAALALSLLVASGVTLSTIREGADGALTSAGGYTWSLLLWYLPCFVMLVWFVRRRNQTIQRPAFWTTLIALLVIGFGLDYLLAHAFFAFPNESAVLLPRAPALGEWVPVEEYLFYIGGFLFILLVYIWCDEGFLKSYNVPDYRAAWQQSGRARVAEFDPWSILLALTIIGIAWLYKTRFADGAFRGGFPGYMAYLAAIGVAPAIGLYRATRRFINWPAFSITFLTVVAISILWEATLAAPFQWWTYQPSQMTGIVVRAWHGLPIEAVVVWLAATFTTVIMYEAVKVWQASGGNLPQAVPPMVRRSIDRWYHMQR